MYIDKEEIIQGYTFSTDRSKLDIPYIHKIASTTLYWSLNISLDVVQRSIDNAQCFAVYKDTRQIGFARLVTDYATFAYLADVFIDEAHRGIGLSKRLMDFIFSIDEFKTLRRMVLVTRDAHSLYEQHGFKSLNAPEYYMELHRPDIYKMIT